MIDNVFRQNWLNRLNEMNRSLLGDIAIMKLLTMICGPSTSNIVTTRFTIQTDLKITINHLGTQHLSYAICKNCVS